MWHYLVDHGVRKHQGEFLEIHENMDGRLM